MRRAGVVVALVAGALVAVPASPAAAVVPELQITSLSSASLTSGEKATLTYKIVNKNTKPPGSDAANIKITSSFGELTCEGQCDFTDQVQREGEREFTATLVAGKVDSGQTRSGKIEVRVEINGEGATAERDISVRGPEVQKPETVQEISGRVVDISTGDAISGAIVAIADSGNHMYDIITNENGQFRFVGTAEKPITPGDIRIGAQKGDIRITKTITVGAGKSLTGYRLVLRVAAPLPTASASAQPTPTPEPALTDQVVPTDSVAAAAPPAAKESDGSGSLLPILVGGVLVALGVGALVLLLLRRKDNGEDDDIAAGTGGVPVGPAYAGAAAATRLGGHPGRHDPTTAALADAPTMMHPLPAVDEFPDPYGAPLPPPQPPTYPTQPGWAGDYAAPTQAGYGTPANGPSSGGGYGTPGAFGAAPASGAGYGDPRDRDGIQGYGARGQADPHSQAGPGEWGRNGAGGYEDRYDEPTGRFRGGDAAGYGRGGYEPSPYDESAGRRYADSGRDGDTGYGQRHAADREDAGYDDYRNGGGYDERTRYDQRGEYDDRNGYDDRRGYEERNGYDRGGGYDRVPEQREAGYENRGYERGDYSDESAGGARRGGAPPSGRSGRRSADWLDD